MYLSGKVVLTMGFFLKSNYILHDKSVLPVKYSMDVIVPSLQVRVLTLHQVHIVFRLI